MLVKVTQIFFLAVLLTVSSLGSIAHSQVINPQQIDFLLAGTIKANGQPNSQGKIYFWDNSSKTTAKTVWSDFGATTPLSNPVVLDARGASNVFAFGTYYCELYDKNDVLIKTYTSISYSYTPESESLFLDVGATYGRSQSDIDEALTDIGTTPKTLLFNAGTFNFTSNTIFPSNVGLFISDTASFNVSSGKTVTINGSLSYAPNRQLFFGAGSYDIDTDRNNIANGLWFGGSGVGIGTQTPAYSLDVVGTVNATTAVNSVVGAFSTRVTSPLGVFSTSVTSPLGVFSTKGQFGSGSAASPSITETTVGISGLFFETGVGALGFSTLGTEKMRITGSGSVGIGLSTPFEKLHVVGNVHATTGLKLGTNIIIDAASNTFLNSHSSNPFVISTTSAQPIQMGVNSGLILELATTGTTFSGVAKFPAGSAAAPSIVNAAATTSGLFWSSTATGVSVAGSERMRVNATGVGIGLTNPAYPLDVAGTARAGFFLGDGSLLTNLNGTQVNSGTIPSSVISGVYSGITGLGTLTALNVDNLNLDLNTISTTSGALNLTPLSGQNLNATLGGTADLVVQGADFTGGTFTGAVFRDASAERLRVGYYDGDPTTGLVPAQILVNSSILSLSSRDIGGGTITFKTGTGIPERMRIDSAGDVGIGTTSLVARLTVRGGQSAPTPGFTVRTWGQVPPSHYIQSSTAAIGAGGAIGFGARDATATDYRNWRIRSAFSIDGGGWGANSGLLFDANTSDSYTSNMKNIMALLGNGNVGIGTASPTEPLHVVGNLRLGTVTDRIFSNNISQISSSAPMSIYSNSETIFKNTNEVEFLRITNTGLVGIGTTSPSGVLDVNVGTGNYAYFRGTAGSGIQLVDTSNPGGVNTQQSARIINSSNNIIITNTSNLPIAHFTARYGANAGRVGINLLFSDSPSYNLHVSGNAYISTSLQIGGTGTVRIAGAASGTGTALIIDGNGDIRPQTSSRRFKKNIYETKLDYTDVLKFELKEFKYKDTDIFVPIGIMAEDTANINSKFVNFDKDGLPYSINQSVVLYSLLGVVKDLKDDNDFTLQTLDALIKKVAKLEAEIKYLRKVDSINANR